MVHLEDPDFYWEATPEKPEKRGTIRIIQGKPSGQETDLLYKRKGGRNKQAHGENLTARKGRFCKFLLFPSKESEYIIMQPPI